MTTTSHALPRFSTSLAAALSAATLGLLIASGAPLAAQSYPGSGAAASGGSTYGFGADDPVGYLVSPHRLDELRLDPHQVRSIRDVAHAFVDRHGHDLREFEHLSHRERDHLRRAMHAHRRAILVDVLDRHQTERFTHLYQSRGGSDRYGHDGLHLGAGSRHGIGHDRSGVRHDRRRGIRHDRSGVRHDRRGVFHRSSGVRHRGGHGARSRHGHGSRHRRSGFGSHRSGHGHSAGPGHVLGRVLGLGLAVGLNRGGHGNRHSRFGHPVFGRRSLFDRGHGHGGHGHSVRRGHGGHGGHGHGGRRHHRR